jgi:hypothetical protein
VLGRLRALARRRSRRGRLRFFDMQPMAGKA